MNNLRSVFLAFLTLLVCGRAAAADAESREPLTPKQIEELVSPIALYPDPLVALILPASTRPSDIVLAARYLERDGDPDRTATEPWDESIKSLARYREVITYLDENLAWTRSLGDCFLDQPDAVMDAIQMVRARARAAGLLKDTTEQEVIVESDEIRIVPANPTVIYVPRYDPEIFYVSSFPSYYYPGPFLTFGIGYGVGAWLSYDCDWRYRSVRIAHRPAYWYQRPDWRARHPHQPVGATTWRRWAPPRHDRRFDRPSHHSGFVLRPGRPRGQSDATPHVAPSTNRRDDGRPITGQSSFRPESQRGPEGINQPRYDRQSPRRPSSVTVVAPDASRTPDASPSVGHRPPTQTYRPASVQQRPPTVSNRPVSEQQRPPTMTRSSPAQVAPPRVHNVPIASPRRDHGNPSSVRTAQSYTPPAPRVTAPPPERSQPSVQHRPSEPSRESRDGTPHRQRAEANEQHLR